MGKVTRKRYAAGFKSKVALEAIKGEQTLAYLVVNYKIHHTMIAQRQAIARPFVTRLTADLGV